MKAFNRFNILIARTGIVALFILTSTWCNAQGSEQKPNILIIYADDWGWGDLHCHGHKDLKTPNLDKLASQGTDFYRFLVGNPVCSPSRVTLLTGNFPARHLVHTVFSKHVSNAEMGMPDWLDPKVTLLPRVLKEGGYTTAHFGKWHLSLHGANITPETPRPEVYGYDEANVWTGPGHTIWENTSYSNMKGEGSDPEAASYLTAAASEHAIDFMTKNRNRPFFINLWIHETHTRISATEEDKKEYPNTPEPQRTYYSAVTRADKYIGKVLATLKNLGLEKNTIVIFASDNGPEDPHPDPNHIRYTSVGSTGGLRGRKRSLYQGGVNTPFIVRWPGKVPAGKVNKTTVISAVDILPTLAAIANIRLPENYKPDGVNILRALKGEAFTRSKPLFWEWPGPYVKEANWAENSMLDGNMMLMMSQHPQRVELYDIEKDREEKNNLAGAQPQKVESMMTQLLEWKASLPTMPRAPHVEKEPKKKGKTKDDEDDGR